ncbi:MAG: hypothetical protein ACP5I1_12155, partial [Candidatus Hinthialibacter sp.]
MFQTSTYIRTVIVSFIVCLATGIGIAQTPTPKIPYELDPNKNLLMNPGAEDGVNGWKNIGGSIEVIQRTNHDKGPHSGDSFFSFQDNAQYASAGQVIDLSFASSNIDQNNAVLIVSAWIHNESTNNDLPGLRVEFLNDAMNVIGEWKEESLQSPLLWESFTFAVTVIPNTRQVRFVMDAVYNVGSGNSCFYDDLYLALELIDPSLPTPTQTPTPIAYDNLVGYWNFDEGSGDVAHDSSGNGIDGT